MNKSTNNLVTVFVAIGAIVLLVLVALLIILDKDPTTYVGSITAIITTLAGLGIIGRKLETIGKNVNGKQTALLDENAKLRRVVNQAGLPTDDLDLLPATELDSIVAEANKLPSSTGQPYTPQHRSE